MFIYFTFMLTLSRQITLVSHLSYMIFQLLTAACSNICQIYYFNTLESEVDDINNCRNCSMILWLYIQCAYNRAFHHKQEDLLYIYVYGCFGICIHGLLINYWRGKKEGRIYNKIIFCKKILKENITYIMININLLKDNRVCFVIESR